MIFANPVTGTIYTAVGAHFYRSQAFGCTGSVYEPRLGTCAHFHRAIDISHGDGACGKDVLAPAAGTVIYAGRLLDGSDAIVIRHAGGWATGYGHTAHVVSKGQRVAKGQKIGDMNASGQATGCHVHFAIKADFPTSGDVNDFWLDDPKYGASGISALRGKGTWADPWPRLEQNVTVHPRALPDINIRAVPVLNGSVFATTEADGRIHRKSDNADLGAIGTPRDWGGTVKGDTYTVGGKTGNTWERIALDGAFRFVASPLAVLSAT